MSQVNRTIAFVLCAICSVGAAALTHYSFKPVAMKEASDVGQPFFPEFQDPTKATSLKVAAYNDKTARVDEFSVEQKDGQWRIPSHHNYPADGQDRLAKTAASLIGVTRGALHSLSADAHKGLNLLDPLDKTITGVEGRGSRITISEGDKPLSDYIIGKKVDDNGERYYVRRADEARSYIAEIKPDLSTKFVDWIKPNLLEATPGSFREIDLDRYHFEENAEGRLAQIDGPKSILRRDSSSAPWQLEGLDAAKDKVKESVVSSMVTALGDLKIVGVRPKPSGLGASLKGDKEEMVIDPFDARDLRSKGFYLARNGLFSNQGEFLAGTVEGVMYHLRFGEVFTGSDEEIEIGSPPSKEAGDAATADEKAKTEADAAKKADDPAKPDETKPDETKKQNRYVFITAAFDENLIGKVPQEPVKPEPPPGYVPTAKPAAGQPAAPGAAPPATEAAPASAPETPGAETPKPEEPAGETKSPDAEKKTSAVESSGETISLAGPPADTPAAEPATTAEPPATETAAPAAEAPADAATPPADGDAPAVTPPPEGGETPAVNPAAPPKDPNAEYEAALKKYELDLEEYRIRKQDFDEKVKKGQELVKKLNNRFADWYYVIPAEVFEDLNVTPEELVEPKDAKPETGAPGLPGGLSFPGLPGAEPPVVPGEAPATPPAESTEKVAEPPATEEKPTGEAPATESPVPPESSQKDAPKSE